LRRVLLGAVALFVVLLLAASLILGTERGTKWVFAQVATIMPIDLEIADVSGTLLTQVGVSSIQYADGEFTASISGLSVNIDWTATDLSTVVIEQLSIRQVALTSSPAEPQQDEALQLNMPDLPIGIDVGQIRLDLLDLNGTQITAIVLNSLTAHEKAIGLDAATASMDTFLLRLRDIDLNVDGDVPVGGEFDWQISASNWSGSGEVSGSLAKLQVNHRLAGDYPLSTHGSIELLNQVQPVFDLVNEFEALNYQEWSANHGRLWIAGTTDAYRASLNASIANEDAVAADIAADAMGDLQGLQGLELTAVSDIATLQVAGDIDWSAPSLDLLLTSNGIDPSNFADIPAGALNAQLRVQASSAEQFEVDVISLSGQWNGQSITAFGKFARRDVRWLCSNCRAIVGDNRINVNGEIKGRSIFADLELNAPSLQQFWPTLAGSLSGASRLRGTLRLPILSGKLTGRQLMFGDWSLGYLSLEAGEATAEDLNAKVVFREGAFKATKLGAGQLDISGELEEVDVTLDWLLDDYAAAADVHLFVDNEVVSGLLRTASLTEPLSGTWSLNEPTNFIVSPDSQSVAAGIWSNEAAEFRHERIELQQDMFSVAAALSNAPVAVFNAFLPKNVQLDGRLNATVDLQQGAGGWNGDIEWRQHDTEVTITASEDDYFAGKLPEVYLSAAIVNSAPTVKATVKSDLGMELLLDASLSELSEDAELLARLQFSGDRWDWVSRLIPVISDFNGAINADVRAGGVLRSPDLRGEVNWVDGSLAVPGLNLPLTEIGLTLTGSNAGDMTVTGTARSGEGLLRVSGVLDDVVSAAPSFNIRLSGDRVTLLNWEDYLLIASPDLEFAGDTSGVHVTGRVAMDEAEINVRELPEGAVTPSDDVQVVGRESEASRKTRITGAVEILLSEDVHLQAFGLDTNLEGQLNFIVDEGRDPRGMGELRLIGGVFKAYGQQLEIETGTMTFTGALDDPLINVRAVRNIENLSGKIVAGINLSGRAQEIQSTLFSDPSMSQADILSYLVIGRPLDEATAADGSNLSNSAYALGLRQAATIVNQVGQSVGLDELSVSGSNQNTTELIAGKQINSDLYARYVYGVFSQVGKLLLRYKLTESFSVEIGAGETQSMDILYTIKKE
jgi:translocation and assembly module TamB